MNLNPVIGQLQILNSKIFSIFLLVYFVFNDLNIKRITDLINFYDVFNI
jgi:hypothetical protein